MIARILASAAGLAAVASLLVACSTPQSSEIPDDEEDLDNSLFTATMGTLPRIGDEVFLSAVKNKGGETKNEQFRSHISPY